MYLAAPPIVAIPQVDPRMDQANSSAVVIPTDIDPRTPVAVVAPSPVPLHKRIRWHHVAIVIVATLVVWWLISGEDPIQTTKEVVKETAEVAKEAASAVGA